MKDLVINQKELTFNNDEMKESISLVLEEYRGLVFTDESISQAKKTVADLRKQQKALKDRIMEVKKIHMKPFDEFKKKADELLQLFDIPINGQVQEYTEMEKQKKKDLIESIYNEIFNDGVSECIPISRIYDSKWENKSTTEKSIREEMVGHYNKVVADLQAINATESEFLSHGLQKYKVSLNVADAFMEINSKEKFAKELKEKEAEKTRQEEIEKAKKEFLDELDRKSKVEVINHFIPEKTEGFVNVETILVEFSLSENEKQSLFNYLDNVGVNYKVVG